MASKVTASSRATVNKEDMVDNKDTDSREDTANRMTVDHILLSPGLQSGISMRTDG